MARCQCTRARTGSTRFGEARLLTKKPDITDEERALFRAYMQGFRTHAARRSEPAQEVAQSHPLDTDPTAPLVQPTDSLQFARSGVQRTTLRHMRRGKIHIDATLDLHGMNLEQAEQQLSRFLLDAGKHRWRYVLIIHGKGVYREAAYPVLKNKVNQWLRVHLDVLAFCSANPFDGGVGAVYVLLRTMKR